LWYNAASCGCRFSANADTGSKEWFEGVWGRERRKGVETVMVVGERDGALGY
jgi:hypothetical protein